jgi:hypothetical protein
MAARAGMKTEWRPAATIADAIEKTVSNEQRLEAERLLSAWRRGVPLPDASLTGRAR